MKSLASAAVLGICLAGITYAGGHERPIGIDSKANVLAGLSGSVTTNDLLDWVWIRRLGNKKDTNSIPILLRVFEADAAKRLPTRDSAVEGEVMLALAGMPENTGRRYLFSCVRRIVGDTVANTNHVFDIDLGYEGKIGLRLLAECGDAESLRFLKETGEKSALCSTLPDYASYLWLKAQMGIAGVASVQQKMQWIYERYEGNGMAKMSDSMAEGHMRLMLDTVRNAEPTLRKLIASVTKEKGREYEGTRWLEDVAGRLNDHEGERRSAHEGQPAWRPDWEGNLPVWAVLNIDGYDESGTAIVKTNVLAGISSNDLVDYKWVWKSAAARDTNAIPLLVRAFNEDMARHVFSRDAKLHCEILTALNQMPNRSGRKYLVAILDRLSTDAPDVQVVGGTLSTGVGLLAEDPSELVTAKLQEWVSKTNDVNYERLIPFAYPILLKRQMKADGVVKADVVMEWLYKHAEKEGFGNVSQPTFDAIKTVVSEMPGKGLEAIQKLKAGIVGERGKDSDAAKWLERLQKSVE